MKMNNKGSLKKNHIESLTAIKPPGGGGTVGQLVCITSRGKKSNFGPKALRKEFSRPITL